MAGEGGGSASTLQPAAGRGPCWGVWSQSGNGHPTFFLVKKLNSGLRHTRHGRRTIRAGAGGENVRDVWNAKPHESRAGIFPVNAADFPPLGHPVFRLATQAFSIFAPFTSDSRTNSDTVFPVSILSSRKLCTNS
jgi:hypothetical protein